jgi:ribosomal protein S18 acetylase RimI-like enzyme
MRLEGEILTRYRSEITNLYHQELGENPVPGLIYFAVFENPKTLEGLQAVASIKNYMGSWYLRGCVVKPKFRGQGLQKQLILERIEYLLGKTQSVRASVYPDNIHSIRNIESTGFEFERKKRLANHAEVLVYKKDITKKEVPDIVH